MRALRVEKQDDTITTRLVTDLSDDDLMPGDVTIDVEYSSVNYKDGLAMMGKPGVIRDYPLIPGIDLVGRVASASSAGEFKIGERVLVNGCGLGETHHGGLAERARVSSDWLVRVPDAISSVQAASIGTAGFTAMLSVLALERNGVLAAEGPVLVTGAAGGVGSIAIALLARLGAQVTASTGRPEEADFLRSLGATDIIDRAELSEPGRPLQTQRWAGAVDAVGGHTLANVLAQTSYGGTVTSCGLAQSADLPTTVMPFILRGVTLAGINSVFISSAARQEAWGRLATDLDLDLLDSLTERVTLAEAPDVAARILEGSVRGRTVVAVQD